MILIVDTIGSIKNNKWDLYYDKNTHFLGTASSWTFNQCFEGGGGLNFFTSHCYIHLNIV